MNDASTAAALMEELSQEADKRGISVSDLLLELVMELTSTAERLLESLKFLLERVERLEAKVSSQELPSTVPERIPS